MSVTGIPQANSDRLLKKSFHRRNDSGELDVFEAARYFSGHNEPYNTSSFSHHNHNNHNNTRSNLIRGGRISLDIPIRHHDMIDYDNQSIHKADEKSNKYYKQPSSPGGRLASFLNSLFSQSSLSRKKKSKAGFDQQASGCNSDESFSGFMRRKRRSSISHFRTSSTNNTFDYYNNTPSVTNSAQTPTKPYKLFRNFNANQHSSTRVVVVEVEKSREGSKKEKESDDDIVGEKKEKGHRDRDHDVVDDHDDDDGAESDSSSDLFELQNYDLGCYSSGLPVYETTNMDSAIKRGPTISNVSV